MNKHTKKVLICATVAVVLESALVLAAHQPSNGPSIFTICLLPFILLGSALGFGEPGFYLSIFLFFFAVTMLGHRLWTQMTKGDHEV